MKPIPKLVTLTVLGLAVACGTGLNLASNTKIRPGGAEPGGPLALLSLSPTTGSRGTLVTLSGDGFAVDTEVLISGKECQATTLVSSGQLVCEVALGAVGPADVTVKNASYSAVLPAAFTQRSFLLVSNHQGAIESLEIGRDGSLTAIDSQATGLSNANIVAADPRGRFVAVSGTTDTHIALLPFDPETGMISAGTNQSASQIPRGLRIDGSGNILLAAVTSGSGSFDVRSFRIDRASGEFALANGVGTQDSGHGIVVPPKKGLAYVVVDSSLSSILTLKLDPTTGTASESGDPLDESVIHPIAILIDPTERFAFAVGRSTSERLKYYRIGENGELSAEGSVSTGAGNLDVKSTVLSPAKPHLFSFNSQNDSLGCFSWDETTGVPSVVGDVTLPSGTSALALEGSGKYLFQGRASSPEILTFEIPESGLVSASTLHSLTTGGVVKGMDTN